MIRTVAHLVDDLGMGGVTRALDYIASGPGSEGTRHRVIPVKRGSLAAPRIEADVIVSHLSISWRNLPMLVSLRATNATTPLVHVEHSYSRGFAALNVSAKRRFRTLLGTAYALFDRVVAVSHDQAHWLTREERVVARVEVIQTSVELAPFAALQPAAGRGIRVVGAIGRFDRQKGFDRLVAAFRTHAPADAELRLFGEGPAEDALRSIARGDARIRFMGPTDDPAGAMAGLDAVAMPSLWEPYGLVALEARAAGRPVLCAPVDGLNDQIAEGAVAVGNWNTLFAWLGTLDLSDRIGPAREAALEQNRRFLETWHRLLGELCREPGAEVRAA